ncbi:MAG: hypothetical protein NWF06_08195 [Candidatus Bathyarchaeota archaeon]|nr:hypothetical protein [Candidatus Bathyarchaeum sp.]
MPKGKPWPKADVKKLTNLVEAKQFLDVIDKEFPQYSEGAIKKKCKRIGLEVVVRVSGISKTTTSELEIPKELPSVEETLKILAGALKMASKPGLDKIEVHRLQVVATLAKTYKELLADYVNYREIEKKLLELDAKYAKLIEQTG